jgi:Catalytic LigB subunit of aromatic ring-opening dioxygenase
MADIVAAAGVPHTPVYPALARQESDEGRDIRDRYRSVADVIVESDADMLVVLTCDHINTFFLDAWPTFAVVAAESVMGPSDRVAGLHPREIKLDGGMGSRLHDNLVRQGFDVMLSVPPAIDHAAVVPLHFLNALAVPVVLVYVNGMVSPMPTAGRCRQLGAAIRDALGVLGHRRVGLVASGAFSLEVGGPRIGPRHFYGIPEPGWAQMVATSLRDRELSKLVYHATPEQLAAAGTVAGEILPWIAAAEAASGLEPCLMDYRPGEGHAFAAWRET